MTINNAASSPRCKLSPSQTLTTCMALHCAINGIGSSGETMMTDSSRRAPNHKSARQKRSPVEKKSKKAKIHSPKKRRATAREKKTRSEQLNIESVEAIESTAAYSSSSELNFQPTEFELRKIEKSRLGRQTSSLPLEFAPKPYRHMEKLEGIEPNWNRYLHQAELEEHRRDAWKFEDESDNDEEKEEVIAASSSISSALNKVSCLGLLSKSLPVRAVSAITCLADLTQEAPVKDPPLRAQGPNIGEGYLSLPSAKYNFSNFMAVLENPEAKINPLSLISNFKEIENKTHKNLVEDYIAKNFMTLKGSLVAISHSIPNDNLQEYIEFLLSIHFKKNHSLYTTSDAILFHSENKINFEDFLDFMLNVKTQDEKRIAAWYLKQNLSQINRYLDQITDAIERKIERKAIYFFMHNNTYTEIGSTPYHFFDIEPEENIIQQLSAIILKLADHKANPNYDLYKEILLSYPDKVTKYLSSAYFNSKLEDEKNLQYTYLNNLKKEITLTSILEKFNRDLNNGIDINTCFFIEVEALINFFDPSERTKAASYLAHNPSLIAGYKAHRLYQAYSLEEKAAQDLKLRTLLSQTPSVNLYSSQEDIGSIQRALQIISNQVTLTKAKESYLGGGDLHASVFVNQEYINIKDAKNFLITNSDLIRKYIYSNTYTNLDDALKKEQLALIKSTYLEKNRELFKAGVIGPSINLVTEDTTALEDSYIQNDETRYISAIANLPSVREFLDHLKNHNKKMTLSELFMLKNFINDSAELNMELDDEIIDAIIKFNHILTWLEIIFKYEYKLRAKTSIFGKNINLAYENNFSQLTFGQLILDEIDKLKAGTNTCDIENILIPPIPYDFVMNFVAQALEFKQIRGYSKLMDFAFRYDFLNKVKTALMDSFEGREFIFNQTFLQMINDKSLPDEEKAMASLLYASILKKNILFKGPFNAAISEVTYNDIMQGKPYSSLTSQQIQGLGVGNSLYEMISAFTNPLHVSMKEWITSAQNLADGAATVCDIVRPLTATLIDITPFKGLVKKVKNKLLNNMSSTTELISHVETSASLKTKFSKIASDNNFSKVHIDKLLSKMEAQNIDPQIQKIVVMESLLLDIDKRAALSGLSLAEYARAVADIRTYHPKLLGNKIFNFDTEAKLMQIELIHNRKALGTDKGKIIDILKFSDRHGISSKNAKILIAEHLGLNYFEKLKFTKLDYPKYIEALNSLTERHPIAIIQCIKKLESLYPTTTTSISSLRRLIKKDTTNIDFTLEPELKNYIYTENFSTPTENSNLLLLSLAEYFGDISNQVLNKLEQEKITTGSINSLHKMFDRWGNTIDIIDTIQSLTRTGSKFILKKEVGKNKHQLFYLKKEINTQGEKIRLYSSEFFQIDGITTNQLGEKHYYIDIDLTDRQKIINWLSEQNNFKQLDPTYLKTNLFNYLDVHRYSDLTNKFSINRPSKVLKIEAKGEPGIIFTPAGMLNAEQLADYLYLHNYIGSRPPTLIELNAEYSGSGGILSSQAQTLSNILGISVVGYNGSVDPENRIVFTPHTNHHLKTFVESSNKKLSQKTIDNIIKAKADFASKKTPIFLDKEPIIPHRTYTEPSAEVTIKLNEIKELVKSHEHYNGFITKPAGKCYDAARVLGGLISKDSNFQDIEYINMMIYNKFPTENSSSDAGNHYAIKAKYKGEEVVIDITAAQFNYLNLPQDGIIDTYLNWQATYQQGLSPASKLVKMHKAKTLSNSHFTVIGRNPFEEVKVEGIEILSDANWYSQTGIDNILALHKQRKDQAANP